MVVVVKKVGRGRRSKGKNKVCCVYISRNENSFIHSFIHSFIGWLVGWWILLYVMDWMDD